MYELVLIYEDQTRFLVGGFASEAEALAWIEEEKTRPYWSESTQFEILVKTNDMAPLPEPDGNDAND